MIDVPCLTDAHIDLLIDQARTYSRAPLIEYLRDGRTVTPTLAAFLADVLEGRAPKPRKRLDAALPSPRVRAMEKFWVRQYYRHLMELLPMAAKGELDPETTVLLTICLEKYTTFNLAALRASRKFAGTAQDLVRHSFALTESKFDERMKNRKRVKNLR